MRMNLPRFPTLQPIAHMHRAKARSCPAHRNDLRSGLCIARRFNQNQLPEAISDFSVAVKTQTNYVAAYLMRARALQTTLQFDLGVKDCDKAIQLDPDNAQAFNLRSEIRQSRRAQFRVDTGISTSGDDPFSAFDTPKAGEQKVIKMCMVCMDVPRNCRLRPCLHACLCIECANELQKRYGCPICGTSIEQVEQGKFYNTFTPDDLHAAILSAGCANHGSLANSTRVTGTIMPSIEEGPSANDSTLEALLPGNNFNRSSRTPVVEISEGAEASQSQEFAEFVMPSADQLLPAADDAATPTDETRSGAGTALGRGESNAAGTAAQPEITGSDAGANPQQQQERAIGGAADAQVVLPPLLSAAEVASISQVDLQALGRELEQLVTQQQRSEASGPAATESDDEPSDSQPSPLERLQQPVVAS